MDTSGRGAWWKDEARVRAGILAIVAAADDEDAGIIGAAIMEVLVTKDDDRIAWVEEQARVSDRFRSSLANAYVWGCVPDRLAERVERAAGVPLPRPTARPLVNLLMTLLARAGSRGRQLARWLEPLARSNPSRPE
jgi:hypothetical protein